MIYVSRFHPFSVPKGITRTNKLKVGDLLMLPGGKTVSVKSITPNVRKDKICNLDTGVPGNLLIANGLLAGDIMFLSYMPEKYKMYNFFRSKHSENIAEGFAEDIINELTIVAEKDCFGRAFRPSQKT